MQRFLILFVRANRTIIYVTGIGVSNLKCPNKSGFLRTSMRREIIPRECP